MAIQQIHQPRSTRMHRVGRFFSSLGDFLLVYWAHIITAVLGTLVLVAIAVPFLSYLGMDAIAKPLFYALHYVCAQIPAHSFYVLGHQLGLCARNFSIYASMFLGSLAFVLSKKRLPGIPWWIWLLFMVPMALDGVSQMFGLRESTWYLRIITGTLFGLGNVWFALPLMQKSLINTTPPPPMPRRPHRPVQQQDSVSSSMVPTNAPMIQVPVKPEQIDPQQA
jgi:uncharacterized membrane protein